MTAPVPWIEAFARERGLRYEPDADERWFRAWEPFATLRVALRYEHALSATGGASSVSVARIVVERTPSSEVGSWIAIVQDERLSAKAATTNDFTGVFGEPLDLVAPARRPTKDAVFDHVFASFSETPEALEEALTPSLRRLLFSWRTPVHAEIRPGGFVVAPVTLSADDVGLRWLFSALPLFREKATKKGQ